MARTRLSRHCSLPGATSAGTGAVRFPRHCAVGHRQLHGIPCLHTHSKQCDDTSTYDIIVPVKIENILPRVLASFSYPPNPGQPQTCLLSAHFPLCWSTTRHGMRLCLASSGTTFVRLAHIMPSLGFFFLIVVFHCMNTP